VRATSSAIVPPTGSVVRNVAVTPSSALPSAAALVAWYHAPARW
jgi:hypothetical protein